MIARIENSEPFTGRILTIVLAILLVAAFLSIQALIGGTRLLFALPAYGTLALAGVLALFLVRAPRPAPDQICLWSALIFFGYIELRAALSPVPYLARFDIYPVLAGLVVYFLTTSILTDAKVRMSIMAALLAAALAHVVVGAIQFRHGDNFMPIGFLQRFDYGHRASGFYICPNHLAGLLEVLGVFGLSITFWSRWPAWAKLLIGYTTVMCYVGLILTASRGGYLSVVGSLLVFVFLSARVLRAAAPALQARIGGAAFIAAVLACVAAFVLIQKSNYLSDRAKNVAERENIRLQFWKAAVQQFKLNPLVGTGSRTYLYYGRKFRTELAQMDVVYVHNDYLQLLSEYGVVGLATFLPFFIAHLRRGWITARRLGPRRVAVSPQLPSNAMALNIGALSAVGAYAVHSFFDFNLHIPANILLMAFVFGILANSGVAQETVSAGRRSGLIVARALLFIIAIFLGIQTWRLAPGEYYTERARTSLRDHRPLAALAFALKALGYEQEDPQLHNYLGKARMMAGERQSDPVARASFYRAALPAFAKARELAPLDETYAIELAFTYDALQRFSEAEWMYGEALAFDPKSAALRHYYEAHLEQWKRGSASSLQEAPPGEPPQS
jgi:O-antigen ligase